MLLSERVWSTHKGLLDGTGNSLSGVLGLSNSNSEKLGTHVGEQSQYQS